MHDDFEDEETAPGDDTPIPAGKDEPRYELLWVEEPGMGMVLRVRPITAARETRPTRP
jgi:hypothetical protein